MASWGHRLMEACKDMWKGARGGRGVRDGGLGEEGVKSSCLIGRNIRVDYWCLICLMKPPPLHALKRLNSQIFARSLSVRL